MGEGDGERHMHVTCEAILWASIMPHAHRVSYVCIIATTGALYY